MLGAIFALFYAAYLAVVQSLGTEAVYLAATGFLYSWYFWWTIILGVIVGVIALVAVVGGGAVGASGGRGPFGAIGGAILGGGVSLLILLVFAIRRGLFVGGAFLLNTALVTNADGGYEWITIRWVLGGLFLLIAFLTRSRSSSSSSSSSS
jgi:hypothetical protein